MLLRTYEPVVGSSCAYDWRLPRQPMVLSSNKALVPTRPMTKNLRTPIYNRGWRAPALEKYEGRAPFWHPSTVLARQSHTPHRIHPLRPGTPAFRCLGTVWSIQGMVFSTPVDAVGLAARIRDELPPGSSQNYAALLILNCLVSYVSIFLKQPAQCLQPVELCSLFTDLVNSQSYMVFMLRKKTALQSLHSPWSSYIWLGIMGWKLSSTRPIPR